MTRKLAVFALFGLLAGCATVDGIGQDISSGARSAQRLFY